MAYSGISYWYPKGVSFEKLKLNHEQLDQLRYKEKAITRLTRLDKYANLSFAVAVIFTFVVLSTFIVMFLSQVFMVEVLGLYDWIQDPLVNYVMAILILLLQLGVFDFLSKKKTVARTRFAALRSFLYNIYYYVSGLFLYRRELLVLRTNGKTWVILSFGTAYLLLCLFISVNQIGDFYQYGTFKIPLFDDRATYDVKGVYNMNSSLYESNYKQGNVFYYGCIQSEIIKDDYLKLFVVHWKHNDYYLKHAMDSLDFKINKLPGFKNDSLRKDFYKNRAETYNVAINQLLRVEIDQSQINDIKWTRYKHPLSEEEGYLSYIPIDSLSKGHHSISVKSSNYFTGTYRKNMVLSLMFWK